MYTFHTRPHLRLFYDSFFLYFFKPHVLAAAPDKFHTSLHLIRITPLQSILTTIKFLNVSKLSTPAVLSYNLHWLRIYVRCAGFYMYHISLFLIQCNLIFYWHYLSSLQLQTMSYYIYYTYFYLLSS